MTGLSRLTLALAVAVAGATALRAETIVLDGSTGAVYDSIGDGWLFVPGAPPPGPAPNGTGDSGNQALAVGLISGVLELRAVAEFPLAPLGGLSAGQVQSATLTFKIDDVIGTFGPGANFDGTASDPIAVYHFPGDGAVTVGDFSPAGATQLDVVNPGVVTDATLANTGAVPFDVDVTAALQAALTNGDVA